MGMCLAAAFGIRCHSLLSADNRPTPVPVIDTVAVAQPELTIADVRESMEVAIDRMAREEPIKVLREAERRYRQSVMGYTCTFYKQELIDGKLTQRQEVQVKYREDPKSVYMHWTKNAGKARRVIYIEDKWTKDGLPAALCQPEGGIARLLVSKILMPINGPDAKAASRRTIDQFGFANALDLILKYSLMANKEGALKLELTGEGTVDDRPTYVFERRVPYTDENGKYPDRVLVYHLDKQTLMPVSCESYADLAKKQLLGRYQYANIRLDVALTDTDFEGATYGM